METWTILAAIILVIVIIDVAAMLWGADSRYDGNHKEWERHQA